MTIIDNPIVIGNEAIGYYKSTDPIPVEYRPLPAIPEVSREQIINTLERTRRIVKRGWTQGHLHAQGKRCLLGALSYAIHGTDHVEVGTVSDDQMRLHRSCLTVLANHVDPEFHRYYGTYNSSTSNARRIYCWNDYPTRTKRQVVKMLKELTR